MGPIVLSVFGGVFVGAVCAVSATVVVVVVATRLSLMQLIILSA